MPYPFAHPAAVLPLFGRMGRFAVPSALVIGSIAPDLWYLLPHLERGDTHTIQGLLVCLPIGLMAYAAFHLLLKRPLAALLPASISSRLAPHLSGGLPRAPLTAVLLSLFVGTLTHLAWDLLTHWYEIRGIGVLQHLSTLLGTGYLAWWVRKGLRRLPPATTIAAVPAASRRVFIVLIAMASATGAWLGLAAEPLWLPLDHATLRALVRAAAGEALPSVAATLLVYCLLWRLRQ